MQSWSQFEPGNWITANFIRSQSTDRQTTGQATADGNGRSVNGRYLPGVPVVAAIDLNRHPLPLRTLDKRALEGATANLEQALRHCWKVAAVHRTATTNAE